MTLSERVILRDEIRLGELLEEVRRGGVIIYPTETSYSLGGALSSQRATDTIFELKSREATDALFAIVYDLRQAEAFATLRYETEARLFSTYGADGLTVLLDAKPVVSDRVRGGSSMLGIRLATTELTRILTERVAEPLTSISASLSNKLIPDIERGELLPTRISDIPPALFERVDFAIEATELPTGVPSTIVRVTGEDRIVLIRQGVLSRQRLEALGLKIETPTELARASL